MKKAETGKTMFTQAIQYQILLQSSILGVVYCAVNGLKEPCPTTTLVFLGSVIATAILPDLKPFFNTSSWGTEFFTACLIAGLPYYFPKPLELFIEYAAFAVITVGALCIPYF
ncbi:hypothetical protein [Turicimonas muris]|uniref:hypothetical protein n=2 Tax=Turicimonas muris TaxID=1796652 RepID=UPI0025B67AF4|nr:hypothetical protein [Turicimonas muris]